MSNTQSNKLTAARKSEDYYEVVDRVIIPALGFIAIIVVWLTA